MITKIMSIIHMLIVFLAIMAVGILTFAILYAFLLPYDFTKPGPWWELYVGKALILTVSCSVLSIGLSFIGIIVRIVSKINVSASFSNMANIKLSAITFIMSLVSVLLFCLVYAGHHF